MVDWNKFKTWEDEEGFYKTPYLQGPKERLKIGELVSLANTLFNTRSGNITVGDGVTFGHSVMVLTGVHDMTVRGRSEEHTSELQSH